MGRALLGFQEQLCLHGPERPSDVIQKVLRRSPKLLYYLEGYSCTPAPEGAVLRAAFRHRDCPPEDVLEISGRNLELALRKTAVACRKQLVAVLPRETDIQGFLDRFISRSGNCCPNLQTCGATVYEVENIPFVVCEYSFSYRIGTIMLRKMEEEVSGAVERLRTECFWSSMPDVVKCFLAHQYLAHTAVYFDCEDADPLERSYLQSAYGALIRKRCVCQGYADAYKRILEALNVPCDIVLGRTSGPDGEWHAWNIVHLRGNQLHCHVDVTFDACRGGNSTEYFLRGDEFFSENREWERGTLPPCQDRPALVQEARLYCASCREMLLKRGFRPEWLGSDTYPK